MLLTVERDENTIELREERGDDIQNPRSTK